MVRPVRVQGEELQCNHRRQQRNCDPSRHPADRLQNDLKTRTSNLKKEKFKLHRGRLGYPGPVSPPGYIHALEGGVIVTFDIEEFQYEYKFKYLGHEWSEKHTEKHVERPHKG